MRLILAILTMTALAGCGQPKQLSVDHAWVRLAPTPAGSGAAYFTVHGGPTDTTLITVSSEVVIRAEMHASTMQGNMATMAPLQSVPVPAGSSVPFAPGGRHVMLTGIAKSVKPGGTMTFTFSFGDGTRILQDADVIAPGDPAPK